MPRITPGNNVFLMVIYGNIKIRINRFQEACFSIYFYRYLLIIGVNYNVQDVPINPFIFQKLTNCGIGVRSLVKEILEGKK